MECIAPPAALKKHRTRQQASRASFVLLSLAHLFLGSWLAFEHCAYGWHVVGFSLVRVHPAPPLNPRHAA